MTLTLQALEARREWFREHWKSHIAFNQLLGVEILDWEPGLVRARVPFAGGGDADGECLGRANRTRPGLAQPPARPPPIRRPRGCGGAGVRGPQPKSSPRISRTGWYSITTWPRALRTRFLVVTTPRPGRLDARDSVTSTSTPIVSPT